MSVLSLEKVTLARGVRVILESLDLAVERGEVLGLTGVNGAGKSTLLKAMAGLLAPACGQLRWQGGAMPPPARRARAIAYMEQQGQCHWPLPVEEVVALGRLPHLGFCQPLRPADRTAAMRAMEETDILHLRTRAANQLSGGETARLMLARALAGEPQLLLADEPVAGIDPAHQLAVMRLLKEKSRAGLSVVMALHDLTLAGRFCDRIALLHQGRILALGAPETVLTEPLLRETLGITVLRGKHENQPFYLPWEGFNHLITVT